VNTEQLLNAFYAMAEAMQANKQMLCDLDGAIGDADHGVTMALGFNAIRETLQTESIHELKPTDVFNKVAKTFLSTVGASAGPLYATAFMRAGASLKGLDSIDATAAANMIEAMAKGIQDRGKAEAGDKTMLDAWLPAADAAKAAVPENGGRDTSSTQHVLRAAADAAEAGAVETMDMIAKKGRSAKLGDRTVGHIDAGAKSTAILLDAFASSTERHN